MQRNRWSDLTCMQQRVTIGLGVVQLALMIAALVDMWRRPPEQVRGSRWLWTLAALVNFVGPILYFLFGRRRGGSRTSA
jgi:hypothetical protein